MRCARCNTPWNERSEGWNRLGNGEVLVRIVCPCPCASTTAEKNLAAKEQHEVIGVFGQPTVLKAPRR